MKNITVAQVAKTAGIGKGTVYEYFENKEDIIFEIINIHIEEYHEQFIQSIQEIDSTREKIYLFFDFVLNDSEENQKHFKGYKDYLSVLLAEENNEMYDFNNSCSVFFKTQLEVIIQEGIDKNELLPIANDFVDGLMVFEKGLVLMKMSNKSFDAKKSCKQFIENFFDLIEVKK